MARRKRVVPRGDPADPFGRTRRLFQGDMPDLTIYPSLTQPYPRELMTPGRVTPRGVGGEINSEAVGLGGAPYQQGPRGQESNPGLPGQFLGGAPGQLAEGSARSLAQALAAEAAQHRRPAPRPPMPGRGRGPAPFPPQQRKRGDLDFPVKTPPPYLPLGREQELERRTRFQPSSGQVGDAYIPEPWLGGGIKQPETVDPNTFLDPKYTGDRDPLAHLRFWRNQGWRYNEATKQFNYLNKDEKGTQPTPTTGGGTQGPRPDPEFGGLIPDALALFQRQQLLNNLTATLTSLQGQRPVYESQYNLGLARLGTNRGREEASKREELADRGLFASGVQNRDIGIIRNLYEREGQDLSFAQAQALAGLESQIQQANVGYQGSLSQVLEELAQRQLQSRLAGV